MSSRAVATPRGNSARSPAVLRRVVPPTRRSCPCRRVGRVLLRNSFALVKEQGVPPRQEGHLHAVLRHEGGLPPTRARAPNVPPSTFTSQYVGRRCDVAGGGVPDSRRASTHRHHSRQARRLALPADAQTSRTRGGSFLLPRPGKSSDVPPYRTGRHPPRGRLPRLRHHAAR